MSGIDDYKITNTSGYKIQDIPGDSMSGTSEQNKQAFDKLGLLIISQYNSMIDYVKTNVIQKQVTLDEIYPVGSIYISVNNTNPTLLFGGTWTPIKDRFLLCAGDTYLGGATGGSPYIQNHTHSFAGNNHTHTVGNGVGGAFIAYNHEDVGAGVGERSVASGASGNYKAPVVNSSDTEFYYSTYTSSTTVSGSVGSVTGVTVGDSGNMPPYLTVYAWKRIADE